MLMRVRKRKNGLKWLGSQIKAGCGETKNCITETTHL